MHSTNQYSHWSNRFKILPDGQHEHHLSRKDVSDPLLNFTKLVWKSMPVQETEIAHCVKTTSEISPAGSATSSTKAGKYGKGTESIGNGSSGSVRLCRKSSSNDNQASVLYAIKSYRRDPRESKRVYRNRATSSFCISSCLNHVNILNTLELVQDEDGTFNEVMSFCPGGNLMTLVLRHEKLPSQEADCFFAQLLRGLEYMHSVGVAHRDLKPENLLLTSNGVLKIADFGEAECFRYPWEEQPRTANGGCGTIPFIAPEVYLDGEFDPRPVDVWATGMIYMAMRTGKLIWGAALRKRDAHYCRYLDDRKLKSGFRPIERLKDENCRSMIYAILNPSPLNRPTASEVLGSQWCREIQLCSAAIDGISS